MGKHGLDDLETRDVNGRIHMQEDSGVAEELLDAEVEHHAVAAVEFHGVLANLEDFLGGEYLTMLQSWSASAALASTARAASHRRARTG
jgi:hypothetical protein